VHTATEACFLLVCLGSQARAVDLWELGTPSHPLTLLILYNCCPDWRHILPSLLLACSFLAQLIFDPEDAGDMFLQNVRSCMDTLCCIPEDGNFQYYYMSSFRCFCVEFADGRDLWRMLVRWAGVAWDTKFGNWYTCLKIFRWWFVCMHARTHTHTLSCRIICSEH
jgi:hypothetical protein